MAGGHAYHEGEKILKEDRKESEFQWAPRNQGNRNGDAPRKVVPVETPANALVVQDGIGGKWFHSVPPPTWNYNALKTDLSLLGIDDASINWRPTGNVIDHTSKDNGSYMFKRFDYVESIRQTNGCSRHMTGNKSFLTDYQEIDGGFVAFGGSTKGVIMLELALTRNPQQKAKHIEYMILNASPLKIGKNEILSAKTTSWNEFSITMASAIICLATNKNFNFSKYIFDNMVKNLEGRKVFANMKRPGKGFSGKVTPLFETMMVLPTEDMGEDSAAPSDSHSTPIHTQPSSSKSQKKKSRRKQRKDILEKKSKEFGKENEVKNTKGRKIDDLDADAEVTLVDETQEMNDDNLMFDTNVLEEQEKEVAEKEVSAADPVTTRCEYYDPALNVEVTTVDALTTTINELTLAQALIEIKAAKPKACKEKMFKPEKPLKKKEQIAMDEEVARNLEPQLQAELEEE
ncbi:hypothetical protein Tco_0762254 [Tanacetum coccineum]